MTALPPPERDLTYAEVGLDIGIVFGIISLFTIGWAAVFYPLAGYALGKIVGAIFQ